MNQALEMVEGGWALKVWPNADYTRYTASFSSFGSDELIGHGKTPKRAIKKALRRLDDDRLFVPFVVGVLRVLRVVAADSDPGRVRVPGHRRMEDVRKVSSHKRYKRYRRLARQIHDLACKDPKCTYGRKGVDRTSWSDKHTAHGMTYPCDCWKLVPYVCQYAVDAENIAARGGRK